MRVAGVVTLITGRNFHRVCGTRRGRSIAGFIICNLARVIPATHKIGTIIHLLDCQFGYTFQWLSKDHVVFINTAHDHVLVNSEIRRPQNYPILRSFHDSRLFMNKLSYLICSYDIYFQEVQSFGCGQEFTVFNIDKNVNCELKK